VRNSLQRQLGQGRPRLSGLQRVQQPARLPQHRNIPATYHVINWSPTRRSQQTDIRRRRHVNIGEDIRRIVLDRLQSSCAIDLRIREILDLFAATCSPHRGEQFGVRYDAAGAAHQAVHDVEFLAGEVHWHAALGHRSLHGIKTEFSDFNGSVSTRERARECGEQLCGCAQSVPVY
jgi:hypothetical protein